ncbi:MAG: hypothetical protein ABIH46_12170 [Chloroflexota bacterium]
MRSAWYIIRSNHILARWFNTLHWPYSLLHLSFVVMGFGLAPTLHLERSLAVLIVFFLAMGVGAHALDLLTGDPLKLSIPRKQLQVAATVTIWAAAAIGVYYTVTLGLWWYFGLVGFGVFVVVAYNLELFRGFFHTDHWFAFSWGAFPFICGYLINHGTITTELVLGAIFCYAISRLQRILSTRARLVRRRVPQVQGWYLLDGEPSQKITRDWLIEPSEKALMWLCLAVPILAVLLVVY